MAELVVTYFYVISRHFLCGTEEEEAPKMFSQEAYLPMHFGIGDLPAVCEE
jgi:ferritin-like protein